MRKSLADQLRDHIEASGLSGYALAKASGVDRPVVYRFLKGDRDITLEVADRIAQTLRLALVQDTNGEGG